MKLNEWKDSNGNKINPSSGSTTVSQFSIQGTSTGFKKRFEKLLAYAKAHKGPAVSKIKIATASEDGFMYTEERKGGYSFYDLDIQVYIGQQTEAWRLRVYLDNKPDTDMSGMGYPNLLKQLRQYINVPTVGTPEYKDILTEFLDKTGKKVSLNSLTVKTSSTTKTNKEKFKELTDYMINHRGSLTARAEVVRLDDSGFTYKEHWTATAASGKGYVLTLLVGFGRDKYYNDWKYELYIEESLAEKSEGTGMADLLKELDKYFHVPKVGSPEHKILTEWVDQKGKKVNTTSSTTSAEPEIPDQAYRYQRLLAQIDSDGFCRYTINLLNDRTLDITLHNKVRVQLERNTEFPIYTLTVGNHSESYDDYEDVLKALIEEGIIGDTDLCESVSSIAEDFRVYENLWD